MYTTNTHDYAFQQAGLIQAGDINQRIHDHLLQKSVLTWEANTYQPTRLDNIKNGIKNWFVNHFASLIRKTERAFTDTAEVAR